MLREPRAERRQGGLLDPLPQRSRPGGRQFAGRRAGGRAAGRMHDQRHRRARRQCRARGDRDGAARCARTACPTRPASRPRCITRASQAGLERHRLSGAVQQGDRRQERLRARIGHPSGRHAEERADLRDHDARRCRRERRPRWSWASSPAATPSATSWKTLGYELGDNALRGRLPPLQGSGRQEEARLRRGHRRAGRRRDRARPRPHPGPGSLQVERRQGRHADAPS